MLAGGPVIIFRIPPILGVGPVGVVVADVGVAVTVSGTEEEGAGLAVVTAGAVVAAVVVTAGAVVAGVVVVPEQAVAMVALMSRITSNKDNFFNLPSLKY